MQVNDFVSRLVKIATEYKTLYVMGAFGAPLNERNKIRYTANHVYNENQVRKNMINSASSDTFAFDCCGLIKGVLWGFNGNVNGTYGGAFYKANGMPDLSADRMIMACSMVSTNMSQIAVGELVWLSGHIGVYVGNGNVVECTPKWKNGVQITKLTDRAWQKHGYFDYVDYTDVQPTKTINEIALDVINGKFGNGAERTQRLTAAGYNARLVQEKVNEILANRKKPIEEIAREVIQGKYGNGEARKIKLKAMGYDFTEVQTMVNKMLL